jgi:hypothetical protein
VHAQVRPCASCCQNVVEKDVLSSGYGSSVCADSVLVLIMLPKCGG